MKSVKIFLRSLGLNWDHVKPIKFSPSHVGWSRLANQGVKSRFYYNLLSIHGRLLTRPSNEKAWEDAGMTGVTKAEWDAIYVNYSNLRCNLRIKFQEFRIIWQRQELAKQRCYYVRQGEDPDWTCGYCRQYLETEMHMYAECDATRSLWVDAKTWCNAWLNFNPPLGLKQILLFGMDRGGDLDTLF